MRSAALFLVCFGVAWAQQLTPEEQQFLDAALGTGGGDPLSGGGDPLPGGGGISAGGGGPGLEDYTRCDGGTKWCVPYYLCVNDKIVTDGAGIINIRFGGSQNQDPHVQHSECSKQYTNVCCGDVKPTPPIPEPIKQYQPQCGRRNALGVNARLDGIPSNETQFGEHPWMAAVLRDDAGRLVYLCGAALIAPNVLATAAHCVYGEQEVVVRLGEWDTQHTTEFYPHEDYNVHKVVIHDGYNDQRRNLHNDMALLFLAENVQLKEHIDTICLPEPHSPPAYGRDCYVTGWGKNSFVDGDFQLVLKQITMPLVDHATCQSHLRANTPLGRRFILDASFTCAGGTGADACTGDGGSPMVCPDPNNPSRYILRGLVSWGIRCGTVGVPGVYVNVDYFNNWINDQILSYQQSSALP